MKKWFYIIPILLMASCSDYVKVGGTYKHGNVVQNINPTPTVVEEITNPINISFWTFYVPFLVIVLYITYRTFKPYKINN
tara:strand:- start:103 stop:342 length:240 start_codon:yes stop_codon:yes gene_type:complete